MSPRNEPVWRLGNTMQNIYNTLMDILRSVEESPDVYLPDTLLCEANIRKHSWDLSDSDNFFACMTQAEFEKLSPPDPLEESFVPYDAVEPPNSAPPLNVWEREDSAMAIEMWFRELRNRKVSLEGVGIEWPKGSSAWVPREKYFYEDLHCGKRMLPNIPYRLHRAHINDDKPHQLYHACFGDEGKDGTILQSEVRILIRCMKGRMGDPKLCVHNIPVLLLSIHGSKARIMIAHFDLNTMGLDIKCSKFEQFDGFEAKERTGEEVSRSRPHDFEADAEEGTGDEVSRDRPPDFEAKRDFFFRWLNPICQGDTFLLDSKDAPELVLRRSKGKKWFEERPQLLGSPTSDSSGSSE